MVKKKMNKNVFTDPGTLIIVFFISFKLKKKNNIGMSVVANCNRFFVIPHKNVLDPFSPLLTKIVKLSI